MANVDRPNGMKAVGKPLRVNQYTAAAAIYPGDPVKLTAAGKVDRAAASEALCGVAVSFAAEDDAPVLVADHPDQYFNIQADGSQVAAQADLLQNYNLAATSAAFNTTYKLSRVELDASSGDSGTGSEELPLKLLGLSREVNNDFGADAKCVVRINNHQLSGGTGTEGV